MLLNNQIIGYSRFVNKENKERLVVDVAPTQSIPGMKKLTR